MRRHRSMVENRIEDRLPTCCPETASARRHLVEHDAEREQIGARVQLLAARLLRRHVGDRAERRARAGQDSSATPRSAAASTPPTGVRPRRQLRQAEIEHLRVAARRDEDVGRLDVAVDDALRVRGVQRVGNLDRRGRAAARSASGLPPMRCFSVCPSSNSMAMNGWPSCSPMSWIVQMFGWLSAEAARASRWNRSSACGSCASSSRQELQRDVRPSRVSSAL